MKEIVKINRISPINVSELNHDRRINPITYELNGEWEEGVYVFDDIFKIEENRISFIAVIKDNKVVKVYQNN